MTSTLMVDTAQPLRSLGQRLSSPELRSLVERFVRRRVPEVEVDDVVQTVMLHALSSKTAPECDEALRKWLVGITRHKVADFHRKGGRVKHVELPDHLPDALDTSHAARDLADWADKQTEDNPDAQRTLDWMAREGDGEKLAQIAKQEQLPATQIRQRVSRMRRFMKQRWAAELAAVAAVVVIILVAWRFMAKPTPEIAEPEVVPDVVPKLVADPAELERAMALRREASSAYDEGAFQRCLDKLDAAAKLDPKGDRAAEVSRMRVLASDGLSKPAPSVSDPLFEVSPVPDPSLSTPEPSTVPVPIAPKQPSRTKKKRKPAPSPASPTPDPTPSVPPKKPSKDWRPPQGSTPKSSGFLPKSSGKDWDQGNSGSSSGFKK